MTKQPDSSVPILPRDGSANAQDPAIIPRLPTVGPLGNRPTAKSARKSQPVQKSKSRSKSQADKSVSHEPPASSGHKNKAAVKKPDSKKKRDSDSPPANKPPRKDPRFKAPPKPDESNSVPLHAAPVGTAPEKKITAFPRITRRRTFDEILEQERADAREAAKRNNNPFYGVGGVRGQVDVNEFQQALDNHEPPTDADEEERDNESAFSAIAIKTKLRRHRQPLSSALVSMTVHLVIFLILAFFILNWQDPKPSIGIFAKIEANPVPEKPVNADEETVKIEIPDDSQSPTDATATDTAINEAMTVTDTTDTIPTVAVTDVAPTNNDQTTVPNAPAKVLPTGGGLEGRENKARARLAAARGGSLASEAAVENGLAWIVAHQRSNGSWRFRHNCDACNGECGNTGSSEDFTNAATGLALMSLMGAGYTNETGPYQKEVQKGIDYLREKIRYNKMDGRPLVAWSIEEAKECMATRLPRSL